jgi:chorismate synthase
MWIQNRDYQNWEERMNPWPVDGQVDEVHLPRPGHADLAGIQKFGHTDVRNVLERASARETAARVAAGAVAKVFLRALGVEVRSHVTRIGTVAAAPAREALAVGAFEQVDESPVRSLDSGASQAMVAEIDTARKANESLGGEFEVIAFGLVPGIGSHVSWEERLDGRLAQAIMSIQALKGVGIGDGFALAGRVGSQAHDEIFWNDEQGFNRETNRAGGVEGGVSNGEEIVVRAAMKPLPTLMRPLRSVDLDSGAAADALVERSDVSAVEALAVVAEAAVAWELARAAREKFGGDALGDFVGAWRAYLDRIPWRRTR